MQKLFSRIRFFLLFSLVLLLGVVNFSSANYEEFLKEMEYVGIDIASFRQKQDISRFEIARLLNAVECENCITPPDWMLQKYTQAYWTTFSTLPDKDFGDVFFQGATFNRQSYYYCVAYVGDQEYMRGYPLATSPLCGGKFCGQNANTKAEFFQSVLNIIDEHIMTRYKADWKAVQQWFRGLKKGEYTYNTLSEQDIATINAVSPVTATISSTQEFQAWLKYCMFNLQACDFQTFGAILQGFWPISELNILVREGVISANDAQQAYATINGEEVLQILYYVYRNYSGCSFDPDYDCDGIFNHLDNCPYAYNPRQTDLDGDGIGNVCDDDIDGDGEKNSIGIVDDNDNIIIGKWDDTLDQTPLGERRIGFSFFIQTRSIDAAPSRRVHLALITDTTLRNIQRDMGDGKTYTTTLPTLAHSYDRSGHYTIKAIGTNTKGEQAEASTRVFIGHGNEAAYALHIETNFSFKSQGVEYTFTPKYQGQIDKIIWTFDNADTQQASPTTQIKKVFQQDGIHGVTAKAYYQNVLKAVAATTVRSSSKAEYVQLTLDEASLQDPVKVQTNLIGRFIQDIEAIQRNRGDDTIDSTTGLVAQHQYQDSGLKTLIQTVLFADQSQFQNIVTLFVANPFSQYSMALNTLGTEFSYAQYQPLGLSLSVLPTSVLKSIQSFTTFEVGSWKIFSHPVLKDIRLDHSYISAGQKTVNSSVEVNRCVHLTNQGSLSISPSDLCLEAKQNTTLSQFTCDMDEDGVPDICDDDIDGDGNKNLIGIIRYETEDCSYTADNLNVDLLRQHVGVCSLDNCPFTTNPDQRDLNNNGIGDVCDGWFIDILVQNSTQQGTIADQDGDGIPDQEDACPTIPGSILNQGCPDFSLVDDAYCESGAPVTCGDGKIDAGETCENCPEDVGVCTSTCGDGKIDAGETCENCPEDVGVCISTCGDGKIDAGETCANCPEDVGVCISICGDGIVVPGETCENCPEDVPVCEEVLSTCGNGTIDIGENCQNCPQDVGVCISICGDGIVASGETCENCPEDVPVCEGVLSTCGNGILDLGEACDDGNNNGKNGKCSLTCKNLGPDVPLTCGDGKIDAGETCANCPEDVQVCATRCGNGVVELMEACDNGTNNGKDGKCSLTCEKLGPDVPLTCGDGKIDAGETCANCPEDVQVCATRCGNGIVELMEACDNGTNNGKDGKCSLTCEKLGPDVPLTCGDGKIDAGETCANCPEDVQVCATRCGNGVVEPTEQCDNGTNNGKDGVCSLRCTFVSCGNGIVDSGETCETCPQDVGRCIVEQNCNTCPCQYADFTSDLRAGDIIRAVLQDVPRNVFYTYSPLVNPENFLDFNF